MLRNRKILVVIVSVAIIFTFSYLVIARTANSQNTATPPDLITLKENNILELGFSETKASPVVYHSIIVDKAAVCLEVKDRQPVQECQRINASAGRIFCWSMLLNGQGKKVRYIWYIGEKASASSWLTITSNRFRAWCPRKIDPKASGPARVDIVDEQGRILKSIEFEIIPSQGRGNLHIKYS
ncbi:MAG: DUF2914 domain-containing protein [Planctomycetes bacterium]|nr:DUF2914 domain-containing protein [Planctomycetota bacterium]